MCNERYTGTIVEFVKDRGFGFILGDMFERTFFHVSNLKQPLHLPFVIDEEVTFSYGIRDNGKKHAIEIERKIVEEFYYFVKTFGPNVDVLHSVGWLKEQILGKNLQIIEHVLQFSENLVLSLLKLELPIEKVYFETEELRLKLGFDNYWVTNFTDFDLFEWIIEELNNQNLNVISYILNTDIYKVIDTQLYNALKKTYYDTPEMRKLIGINNEWFEHWNKEEAFIDFTDHVKQVNDLTYLTNTEINNWIIKQIENYNIDIIRQVLHVEIDDALGTELYTILKKVYYDTPEMRKLIGISNKWFEHWNDKHVLIDFEDSVKQTNNLMHLTNEEINGWINEQIKEENIDIIKLVLNLNPETLKRSPITEEMFRLKKKGILASFYEINNTWDDYFERESFVNDYENEEIKHFLINGFSGTGKTRLIHELAKLHKSIIISFSHSENSHLDGISRNRVTIFQLLFNKINEPYEMILSNISEIITKQTRPKRYKIKKYDEMPFRQREEMFKNINIGHDHTIAEWDYERIHRNFHQSIFKPLMTIAGIKNNYGNVPENVSLRQWYESNVREINKVLYKKKFLTPYSLFNTYLKGNLSLDLADKTLFIDDGQNYSILETKVLNKMIAEAGRSVVFYDESNKIFDFRDNEDNQDKEKLPFTYTSKFEPKTYNLTRNYRSEGFIVQKANEYLSILNHNDKLMSTSKKNLFVQSSKVQLLRWIENLQQQKVIIVFRTNNQVDKFSDLLSQKDISHIKITNDYLETRQGFQYSNFLFKYLLSDDPSPAFSNSIRNSKVFNIMDWNKFIQYKERLLKINILDYEDANNNKIFMLFNDNRRFEFIAKFLLNETNKSDSNSHTLRDAIKEYLNNPYLYPYYDTYYHKQIFDSKINVFITNFHRLKEISQVDYVIFPYVENDQEGLNYVGVSKSTTGYGLFDFKIADTKEYMQYNTDIANNIEMETEKFNLYTLDKNSI